MGDSIRDMVVDVMKILALDPSGNFKEGFGTTGIAVREDDGSIILHDLKASDFKTPEAYWAQIIEYIIVDTNPDELVIEGYKLYGHKSKEQTNSELETPQLIGAIKYICHVYDIPLTIQFATEVKNRWSEDVLVANGTLEKKGSQYYFNGRPTNQHKRDALKHLLHFMRYKVGAK